MAIYTVTVEIIHFKYSIPKRSIPLFFLAYQEEANKNYLHCTSYTVPYQGSLFYFFKGPPETDAIPCMMAGR